MKIVVEYQQYNWPRTRWEFVFEFDMIYFWSILLGHKETEARIYFKFVSKSSLNTQEHSNQVPVHEERYPDQKFASVTHHCLWLMFFNDMHLFKLELFRSCICAWAHWMWPCSDRLCVRDILFPTALLFTSSAAARIRELPCNHRTGNAETREVTFSWCSPSSAYWREQDKEVVRFLCGCLPHHSSMTLH